MFVIRNLCHFYRQQCDNRRVRKTERVVGMEHELLIEMDGSRWEMEAAEAAEFSDSRQHTDGRTYKLWMIEYAAGLVRQDPYGRWQNVFELNVEDGTSAGDESLVELFCSFDSTTIAESISWWDERFYIDAEGNQHSTIAPDKHWF